MKKLLLSLAVCATTFAGFSQVNCVGVSPAAIAGDYEFTWAQPAPGGAWGSPDFLIAGTFVEDTLAMVEDGSTGTNPQGNPISQEGCNPLINASAVAGKIAVCYRNTCEFGAKAANAEAAGAVALIVINRDNEVIGMGAGTQGPTVGIPVVMLSSADGAALVAQMQTDDVVMFIGNKIGLYANDIGMDNQFNQISPFGAQHENFDAGFNPGAQFVNWGQNALDVTITANIDGPSGTSVYNSVQGPFTMQPLDTIAVFDGFANSFAPFTLGTYPLGEYTLTYTIDHDSIDGDPGDNSYESRFSVNDQVISRANLDGSGAPAHSSYPSNTDGEYQSCMFYEDPNAQVFGVEGIHFVPFTDTSVNSIAGEEVLVHAYLWDDPWADLNDATFQTVNGAFTALSLTQTTNYIINDDSEVGQVQYAQFPSAIQLVNNQRYLFCVQTFTPYLSFGYDNDLDYDGNINVGLKPVGPILTQDDTQSPSNRWFSGGWSGSNAPSIAIQYIDPATISLDEINAVETVVYPNPTTGEITLEMASYDNAEIVVLDLAGKTVLTDETSFANGTATMNLSSLEDGVYVFNVTYTDGSVSQFRVVKR